MNESSTNETPLSKNEFKKMRAEQATRRKNVRRISWAIGIVAGITLLVAGGMWWSQVRERTLPGAPIQDQGREHVGPEHTHTYNSNPPTSGWHYGRVAEWGVYQEELPDELVIHNLEHGGIWISYTPDISEEMRKKLEGFYEKYGRKIIVTPRARNDADIALAAWTRLDTFNVSEYSDKRVEKFIKAFRNKGPEFVP